MKESKYLVEIGQFRGKEDGTLEYVSEKQTKDGATYQESEVIANHVPVVQRLERLDNGTEISESLVIMVRRAFTDTLHHMTIDQLFSQNPNKVFGASCIIYRGRWYQGMYRECIQSQCANLPILIVYQHTGITDIDGKRVFLNAGYSVTKDGLTDAYNVELENQLKSYGFIGTKTEDRFSVFKVLLRKLAPPSVMYPAIAYCFQTASAAIYRELGIEPSFVLYIIGKTGSRKTCLAKIVLNFFGRFDYGTPSPAGFRDTLNSIEKKLSVCDGIPLLIDDRIPTPNAYLKSQIEQVEQGILRLIGDRSARGRSNADGSLRANYTAKAGCIVTAEDGFSNVTESGVARAFSVPLKPDDINLDQLTFLQENADRLNMIMADYIQWILNKWDELKDKIYPAFVRLRKEAQTVGHGRLADAVAHLTLSLTIMCEWLQEIGQITGEEAHQIKKDGLSIFTTMATEQNKQVLEDKPTRLFLDALREMKETGSVHFVNLKGTDDICHDGKIGYYDKEYYYLIPETADSAVRQFYKRQEKSFPLSTRRIRECLADEGYLVKDGTQLTKVKRIYGQLKRYIWLYRRALDDEMEV